MIRSWSTVAALALALAGGAYAAEGDDCADDLGDNIPFPVRDMPDAAVRATLAGCDSEALYYGIDQPADPVRARLCAFAERGRPGGDEPFRGDYLLLTIYANGAGVPRNLDLARRLTCRLGGNRAEVAGRLQHIAQINQQKKFEDFSWCDDATGSFAAVSCAQHAIRLNEPKRAARLKSLGAHWVGGDAALLSRLLAAADAFATARGNDEMSPQHPDYGGRRVEERAAILDQLTENLERVRDGKTPVFATGAAVDADARLNAIYRKIMKTPPDSFAETSGGVTLDAVRNTERVWLKYRDAWVAFLGSVSPALPRANILNGLTQERAEQLGALGE